MQNSRNYSKFARFYSRMKLIETRRKLEMVLARLKRQNQDYALVPTMGALHEGHLSLIRHAQKDFEHIIVSIFVNPTQFNDPSDLDRYPRQLDEDLASIRKVAPNSLVFAPQITELYPDGLKKSRYDLKGLDTVMEGRHRKGHFDGVCTVVEALFRLIEPKVAYFGEKDFQQLQIIRLMVRDRSLPVRIIGCPIIREESGLAMSSRNALLPPLLRKKAARIYATLKTAKAKFGMKSANKVTDWVRKEMQKYPEFELEYFQISEEETLQAVKRKQKNKKYRAFIAVYISGIRLIDNIAL